MNTMVHRPAPDVGRDAKDCYYCRFESSSLTHQNNRWYVAGCVKCKPRNLAWARNKYPHRELHETYMKEEWERKFPDKPWIHG